MLQSKLYRKKTRSAKLQKLRLVYWLPVLSSSCRVNFLRYFLHCVKINEMFLILNNTKCNQLPWFGKAMAERAIKARYVSCGSLLFLYTITHYTINDIPSRKRLKQSIEIFKYIRVQRIHKCYQCHVIYYSWQ